MRIPASWHLKLVTWAVSYIRRPPDFVIGEATDPYLSRWWVFRKRKWLPCVYLHQFHKSDDDRALHDHPWFNCSILIMGTYYEHRKNGKRYFRQPGFIYFRHPWTAHRVELPKDGCGIEHTCFTLFITGPKIRNWGFHCPKGWRPWWEYVSVTEKGNAIGRGCDD